MGSERLKGARKGLKGSENCLVFAFFKGAQARVFITQSSSIPGSPELANYRRKAGLNISFRPAFLGAYSCFQEMLTSLPVYVNKN